MQHENLDMDNVNEARRKGFAKTIRKISVEELKSLGDVLFPLVDHPWREVYFQFIADHPECEFHYATTDPHIHVIYCHDQNKGMWFIPHTGMGPLQQRGLGALKEIVETGH